MFDFLGPYLTYLVSALIILLVIVICMMVYRALASTIKGRRGSRLGISEYHEVDKMRRLVLVRRDGIEHLLLIGGDHDLVVETGIGREEEQPLARSAPAARLEAIPVPDEEHRPIPMRPAPRPAIFGERKPELRPVERGEPRFSETRGFEPDKNS